MKLRYVGMLAIWLILVALLGACSRLDDDQTALRAGATAVPVDAVLSRPPTPPVTYQAEAISLPSLDEYLSSASSYRWRMAARFEGLSDEGQPVSWQQDAEYAASTAPPSWSLRLTSRRDGQQAGPDSLSAVRLGEVSYLLVPGVGCMGGSAEAVSGVLDNTVLPGRFLPGIRSVVLISTGETVGGIVSRHYRFNEQDLVGWEDKETMVDGHLYLSEASDQLLRVTMEITGRDDYLADGLPANGSLAFELDIFDINQPLTLQPPPECVESLPYPVLEGAYEITSIDDLLAYRARVSLDQAVAFYQEWMPKAGWSELGEATVLVDSAVLNYQRNGQAVIVSIEYSEADPAVTVLVSP